MKGKDMTELAEMGGLHKVRDMLIKNRNALEGSKKQVLYDANKKSEECSKVFQKFLKEMIPNLNGRTLKKLMNEFPGFEVPLSVNYFFYKKVESEISVDELRTRLAAYISKLGSNMPKIWRDNIDLMQSAKGDLDRLNVKIGLLNNRILKIENLILNYDYLNTSLKKRITRACECTLSEDSQSLNYKTMELERCISLANTDTERISLFDVVVWYHILGHEDEFRCEASSSHDRSETHISSSGNHSFDDFSCGSSSTVDPSSESSRDDDD